MGRKLPIEMAVAKLLRQEGGHNMFKMADMIRIISIKTNFHLLNDYGHKLSLHWMISFIKAITTITYFSMQYCFYFTFMAPNEVFTYSMSRI